MTTYKENMNNNTIGVNTFFDNMRSYHGFFGIKIRAATAYDWAVSTVVTKCGTVFSKIIIMKRGEKMTNLATEVQRYLSANGIKHNFFSEKIGITSRKCSRWFAGLENLTADERNKA